jgi:hypothetical protein
MVREGFLSRFFLSRLQGFGLRGGFRGGLRGLTVAAVLGLLVPVCLADGNNPITLDTSETLFAVLKAINTCGYSVGLNVSDPQRAINRSEVEKNLKNSPDAQTAMTATRQRCGLITRFGRPVLKLKSEFSRCTGTRQSQKAYQLAGRQELRQGSVNMTVGRLSDIARRIGQLSSPRCKCEQSPARLGREPRVAGNSLAALQCRSPRRQDR